ncbi:hypothetical protein TREMEDRAFT_62103 [Tremella mesenterica DSM 1558]|uniref:uncharacterized protein n=1 Tax=Tremella mesenterica (strain ATCC 24925 / CBS 8224 / DSM 1558 / NBRC 9311 / NRRL Y-6157 / RJB 2259-6 / UBC 559-6) TaxID=578456 RepID=UPI0003F49383|nr:uncharacterized protein TREMEDRAFT_62103 [Tremella mesenterica DSM 1558]EIW69251.1 hypothetical protein TREMEDRAFT_62103 [Tremella mesenterica DSM 1558]
MTRRVQKMVPQDICTMILCMWRAWGSQEWESSGRVRTPLELHGSLAGSKRGVLNHAAPEVHVSGRVPNRYHPSYMFHPLRIISHFMAGSSVSGSRVPIDGFLRVVRRSRTPPYPFPLHEYSNVTGSLKHDLNIRVEGVEGEGDQE